MKVIHLDVERKRRQLSCSQQLVARMAKSLAKIYSSLCILATTNA